ncbi:MAG: pimeloyl-ACP methyl ester carboxylesterase [Paraglaciecola psychrophila]|jgi:pimeloyl-ACP methyl ester carboxylesterase
MSTAIISEHVVQLASHRCAYLACGPERGPVIVFVHGWPELSHSWRHQLPAFAALGFRCIAPDMRGYGKSSTYSEHAEFTQEKIVADMLGLIDSLGLSRVLWVGHDWGSAVVWNIASHHPQRCAAVVSLCVPYMPGGLVLEQAIEAVDRRVYPEDVFPAGQWEYMYYYQENFAKATSEFDRDLARTFKILFRSGSAEGAGLPAATSYTRINGGWFGDMTETPDLPIDQQLITEQDLAIYVEGMQGRGFFGADSWYMNHSANAQYGERAVAGGVLSMPVLFIAGQYDYTCETINSSAKEPMLSLCKNLTQQVIKSGHWMAQEQPLEVNATLAKWLATEVSDYWPQNA